MKYIQLAAITLAAILTSVIATTAFNVQATHLISNQDKEGSKLRLSFANVARDIPMSKGYYEGKTVYFIHTEASDESLAKKITDMKGFKVVYAPALSTAPKEALSKVFIFNNGVNGNGTLGFQPDVVDNTPAQVNDYSPLRTVIFVTWFDESDARELKSVDEVIDAWLNDEVNIERSEIIVNMPMIKWAEGAMKIRNEPITDEMEYMGGGQVTKIDTENLIVTFIAHRGWGPDGKTIYYIVTDATPKGPADMMGVVYAPKIENLTNSAAAVDLFQFGNGIKGSGPMGFQAGIGAANPGDLNYSPMWRISFINWNNPDNAKVLETLDDIQKMVKAEEITIELAMDGKHIVNCPFIEI
ncbi:MAG: hypothetical protein D6752_03710 [Candidatus Nitrosothermus koennekii]|nr:MAG: hypothetical protein D6752_03710 [Candidatus Nitrosothermus koennekii]